MRHRWGLVALLVAPASALLSSYAPIAQTPAVFPTPAVEPSTSIAETPPAPALTTESRLLERPSHIRGDAVTAIGELRDVVRASPESVADRLMLAQSFYRIGDLKEQASTSGIPQAQYCLGNAYRHGGRRQGHAGEPAGPRVPAQQAIGDGGASQKWPQETDEPDGAHLGQLGAHDFGIEFSPGKKGQYDRSGGREKSYPLRVGDQPIAQFQPAGRNSHPPRKFRLLRSRVAAR